MDNLIDWFYGQIVGFLGNFFSAMGNMGVEIFELEWVQAIVLFFSQLGWALYGVSLVVCAFEFGIEYTTGRANLQHTALGAIKGFLAVSLFTILPVRLYALSVSLQGQLSAGLTGYGTSIGDVGQQIITDLGSVESIADMTQVTLDFGFGVITSPIMLLFCIILMAYAVIKVFFANLKRGGILLIQIAVGSLYMFSIPRGLIWPTTVVETPARFAALFTSFSSTAGVTISAFFVASTAFSMAATVLVLYSAASILSITTISPAWAFALSALTIARRFTFLFRR